MAGKTQIAERLMTDTTYFQFLARVHRSKTTVELTVIAQELREHHRDDPRRPDIGEAIAQRRMVLSALSSHV